MIKTIIMILISLQLGNAVHAMHDAKTDADSANILKAKAQLEKTEANYDGLLDALGNVDGVSLIAQIVQDTKEHEEQKKKKEVQLKEPERKAALQAWKEASAQSGESIGFEKLFELPYVLQHKILCEYYRGSKVLYVLRHKRELAPLVLDRSSADACEIFGDVDYGITYVKGAINLQLKVHPSLNPTHPNHPYNKPLMFAFNVITSDSLNGVSSDYQIPKAEVAQGRVHIAGYNDRTYNIYFNEEQLKNLMDSYSFEQLTFFVSLAKIPIVRKIAGTQLSGKDCSLFASLDAPMQAKLKKLYWWIDFYTPHDCALSIDDRIEWAQNKLIAYGAYWFVWATERLPYLIRNSSK